LRKECFDQSVVSLTVIKTILKKNLPAPFLKEAFLIYNKIKILTVDKLLFPEYRISPDQFLIYRKGFPFRESEIAIDDLPLDKVKGYMQSWYDWTQEEFILVFNKKCCIEPVYGWAIAGTNRLVYYSLGVSRTWFQQKPSLFKFFARKDITNTQKAISLRDSGEENYFHFYNDVLSKLFFLQQHDIDVKVIPVIVSRKLWDKEYFQYYFKNSLFLQSLNWIIQDKQYIQCESIIFCKPLTHRKDLWKTVFAPLIKSNTSMGQRKIFLTRSKSRLRFIENIEEIEAICQRHGFTVLDTDNLLPQQQIEIFFNAGFLVGIHGAGLTNMAFRRGTCRVMELFPPPDLGYLPYHYVMLAKMLGFQYNAMIGEPGRAKYSGGFHLPPDKFENALLGFCNY